MPVMRRAGIRRRASHVEKDSALGEEPDKPPAKVDAFCCRMGKKK